MEKWTSWNWTFALEPFVVVAFAPLIMVFSSTFALEPGCVAPELKPEIRTVSRSYTETGCLPSEPWGLTGAFTVEPVWLSSSSRRGWPVRPPRGVRR